MSKYNISHDSTIIYPYSEEFAPVLTYLLDQGAIGESTKLVSPVGWGVTDLDAGAAYGRPRLGVTIEGDFDSAVRSCKTFIVAPFQLIQDDMPTRDINHVIEQNIKVAISHGANIIDLRESTGIDTEQMQELYTKLKDEKYEIDIPIVFISGIFENTNKLDTELRFQKELAKRGYKVTCVGSRQYSDVTGVHSFPKFMLEKNYEADKIDLFRAFIYNIYITEMPDVIIISIPGASSKFNDKVGNGYGIINYLIASAIQPDFSIVCTSLTKVNDRELSTAYQYKFGYEIDCLIVSNKRIYYDPGYYSDRVFYEIINYEQVDLLIENSSEKDGIPCFNIFREDDIRKMVDLLINQLGSVEYYSI